MTDREVFARAYSHIYVEYKAADHPRTRKIIERFPGSRVILIDHYSEIFNRKRQDHRAQRRTPALILAKKDDGFLYPGAPVCQSFGNTHYYYTSCMMNCIFDCEYCFLKGMYRCSYPVIFVNLEDYFAETDRILSERSAAVFVSYDTDMLAAESLVGYALAWSEYAGSRAHPSNGRGSLSVEIRTKSADMHMWDRLVPYENVVYAFTLSPQYVIESFEHGTPSLQSRLRCAKRGMDMRFPVRLCFDPMIYCPGWREKYDEMLSETVNFLDMNAVTDLSIGTFRISEDYLKRLRRAEPDSAAVWYPFEKSGGYYHYDQGLISEMEEFLSGKLQKYICREKIFRWD